MEKKIRAGWMYILECSNGTYYTGSTVNLWLRLNQHWAGTGANHTRKFPPIRVVYTEHYKDVREAFYREKQIQRWSHKKKEALFKHDYKALKQLAQCQNDSHYINRKQ